MALAGGRPAGHRVLKSPTEVRSLSSSTSASFASIRSLVRLSLASLAASALSGVASAQEEAATFWSRETLTGAWGGLRPDLEQRGISLEGTLITHTSRAFEGGLEERDVTRYLLDFALTFDLGTLAGLEGATLGFDLYKTDGHNGGDDVGALQGISNIDSIDRSQIAEAWYEQLLLGESLRLKLGKVDVNSEFAYADFGGEFTNPSAGISPTIGGAPTYPDPATSVNLFYAHPSGWSLGLGVYDGATLSGDFTGSRGPSSFFGEPSDLFLIGELGARWTLGDDQRAGRVGLGAWRHTGDFDEFSGGVSNGTGGYYLVLDQELSRAHPELAEDTRGWGGYLMLGIADDAVSEIELHVGLGLVRTGALESCPDDVYGLGCNWAALSEDAGFSADEELEVELFYRHQLLGWCSLKPDVQYILNPGGDEDADDAWVAALRLEIGI